MFCAWLPFSELSYNASQRVVTRHSGISGRFRCPYLCPTILLELPRQADLNIKNLVRFRHSTSILSCFSRITPNIRRTSDPVIALDKDNDDNIHSANFESNGELKFREHWKHWEGFETVCGSSLIQLRALIDRRPHRANPSTIQDKFMVGYQGW